MPETLENEANGHKNAKGNTFTREKCRQSTQI